MNKILKLFLILLAINISLFAYTCEVPNKIRQYDYHQSRYDWSNKNVKTVSYVLAISNSYAFCAKNGEKKYNKLQCMDNKFGFVVHGLWGQGNTDNYKKHPRNCVDAPPIDINTLRKHLCIMPSVELMQKEWEKHGTCDFKTPEKYLDEVQDLYSALKLPSREYLIMYEKSPKKIKEYIIKHNKAKGLTRSAIKVISKKGIVTEVHICYDKKFNYTSCRKRKHFYSFLHY